MHLDPRIVVKLFEYHIASIASRALDSIALLVVLADRDANCREIQSLGYHIKGFATVFFVERRLGVSVAHAIEDEDPRICIIDSASVPHEAKLVAVNKRWDIALIESDDEFEPLPITDTKLALGQLVLLVGMGFGTPYPSTSLGIVTSVGRSARIGKVLVDGLVQLSTLVSSGMSGGPVLNMDGEVVGMALARTEGGYTLAIPSSRILSVLRIFKSLGKAVQPYIGVRVLTVVPRAIPSINRPVLLVTQIDRGSPAEECGLRCGDLILEIDGRPMDNVESLWRVLEEAITTGKKSIEMLIARDLGDRLRVEKKVCNVKILHGS